MRAVSLPVSLTSRIRRNRGFVQFAQVGDFRGPIVHFQVNVTGIFAVPGGEKLIVPDSLKIGGLPAGLG